MKQLEKIVQELEDGDLPLEKALKKFEEGMKLTKLCSEKLDATEKKVSILLKNADGTVAEQPLKRFVSEKLFALGTKGGKELNPLMAPIISLPGGGVWAVAGVA